MVDLRNSINSKEIIENGNPRKVIGIVEKVLNFNKQQKDKELKILTPKQRLQILLVVLAQVKAGNTPKKLLDEIRYSLYQAKEITKKVSNNIINSIKL